MFRYGVITKKGLELLAKSTANSKSISFTKIVYGNGRLSAIENCQSVEAIKETMADVVKEQSKTTTLGIVKVSNSESTISVEGVTNGEVASFSAKEAALYAKFTENDDDTELVFAYFITYDYLGGTLVDTADYVYCPKGKTHKLSLSFKVSTADALDKITLFDSTIFKFEEIHKPDGRNGVKFTKKDETGENSGVLMDGLRGSQWHVGTAITGNEEDGTIFPESGLGYSLENDMYFNKQLGNFYKCTTQGTPDVAKWSYIGQMITNDVIQNIYCKPGTIQIGLYQSAPNGWLMCDGSEVSKSTYARLYKEIGDKFGTATNTDNFVLPDFRECVLVGAGENKTLAIASHDVYEIGQFKDDQLQNIIGKVGSSGNPSFQETSDMGAFNDSVRTYSWSTGGEGTKRNSGRIDILVFNVSRAARAGTTTHGKQVGVNYIIKY